MPRGTRSASPAASAMFCACGTLAVLLYSPPATAAGSDISLSVAGTSNLYQVEGGFDVPVSAAIAWNVLADYDHISRFVPSVHSSSVEHSPDGLIVHQEVVAGVFPFHRTLRVALAIHEDDEHRIDFKDTLGRDFEHYAGRWMLVADSAGTHVTYTLNAELRSSVPDLIGRGMMGHSARQLLKQVRDEMVRRANATRTRDEEEEGER
jgi:carbon monoxide dehydrogenase subunit G